MKVVALLPFRNEAGSLPGYMQVVASFAEVVLGFDDGSSDGSRDIFTLLGGMLVESATGEDGGSAGHWQKADGEHRIRTLLLERGREIGGTHFVFLDADECPSAALSRDLRQRMQSLRPGEKLAAKWVCAWDGLSTYRWRPLIGEPGFKDFVLCDDGLASYEMGTLHFGRTPGSNYRSWRYVRQRDSVLLHLQYVDFEKAVLKQLWYQLVEMSNQGTSWRRINLRYRSTFSLRWFEERRLRKSWIERLPDGYVRHAKEFAGNALAREALRAQILKMLSDDPPPGSNKLGIWAVPGLRSLYTTATGAEPAPVSGYLFLEALADLRSRWINFRI